MADTKEKTKKENKKFSAEVGKVLQLVIHSLYTNKDIFLRELISNASDACDKLRYLSVSDDRLVKDGADLKIKIATDKKAKTITISDNGIGMSKKELVDNLGTIARSGTQNFMQKLGEKNDVNLIGQFGVGFYSAFMVAEKVRVVSKKAGEDKAYAWESKGEGEYEIEEVDAKDVSRGTIITLHIREKDEEFLDRFRLHHIIKTYSDHISFPVELVDAEDGKTETVNSAKALWLKPKSEISEKDYQKFYRSVAHAIDKPFMILHNKAEGQLEYTNLLFIPSEKPFDLYNQERMTRVKLYVKRVFITEQNVDIIPKHLRFMQGVVDSEDLPLNISRETLQNNAILKKIKKSITTKTISELKKKSEKEEEEYLKFWNNFGACLKEGLCDALENKDEILEICRFATSEFPEKLISLEEYIKGMKEGQNEIFFLTGEDFKTIAASPQLEGFKAKNINVILLSDHVDDFWTNVVFEYKGKEFKSITRSGIELDKIKSEKEKDAPKEEKNEADIEGITKFFKESLGEKVRDVVISKKLVESPVCLAAPEGTLDLRMEKFLHEQKQIQTRAAKILEINPKHQVIKEVANKLTAKKTDEAKDAVSILFDMANVAAGENVDDPAGFIKRISKLLQA